MVAIIIICIVNVLQHLILCVCQKLFKALSMHYLEYMEVLFDPH